MTLLALIMADCPEMDTGSSLPNPLTGHYPLRFFSLKAFELNNMFSSQWVAAIGTEGLLCRSDGHFGSWWRSAKDGNGRREPEIYREDKKRSSMQLQKTKRESPFLIASWFPLSPASHLVLELCEISLHPFKRPPFSLSWSKLKPQLDGSHLREGRWFSPMWAVG